MRSLRQRSAVVSYKEEDLFQAAEVEAATSAAAQRGALRRFAQKGVDNTVDTRKAESKALRSKGRPGRRNVRSDSSSDEEFQKMEMGRAKRHRQGRSQRPSKRTLIEEDDEDEGEEDEVEDASDASDDDSDSGDEMEVDDDKEERSETRKRSAVGRVAKKPQGAAVRQQPRRAAAMQKAAVESVESEEGSESAESEDGSDDDDDDDDDDDEEEVEVVEVIKRPRRAAAPQRKGAMKGSEKKVESEDEVVEEGSSEEEESGEESEEEDSEEEGLKGEIGKIFAVKGLGAEQVVLVKYNGLSHHHNHWVSARDVLEVKPQLLKSFLGRHGVTGEFVDENGHPNGINPDWLKMDRVIGTRLRRGSTEYLVKWASYPYTESTWEPQSDMDNAKELISAYHTYNSPSRSVSDMEKSGRRRRKVPSDGDDMPLPSFLNDRKLRDYQEISLKWNLSNWSQGRNCILGDEMGLGKTAQSIAVLEAQRQFCGFKGPFLIVAPLTTLGHWKREIETWTPMKCILYSGTGEDRKLIQEYEMKVPARKAGGRKELGTRFDVMLTSYENLRMDIGFLKNFYWHSAIMDEAHRLKSVAGQTRQAIVALNIDWLLLLTGTPIQNNLSELFGLLNLLDPERYGSKEEFDDRFGADGVPSPDQIGELQAALRPILLRRMKEDVESLPEKEEVIIWVELTREQRAYYKGLYNRDIATLLSGASHKNLPNMRNLAMELRKVCCHPYLCNGLETDISARESGALAQRSELDRMVAASGKMLLLHKLLPKLKAEGHKVLIFSQFVIMLNVLEDYLRMAGHNVERIDGSTAGNARQAAIDRYCKEGSDGFVFLLSTKAGGQGITLTAADVVILYDSDWNPQNDLQAMARCHRIGQTRDVKIYRLVSRDTYEEAVFQTSSKKYGLDEAVLGGMGSADRGDPEMDRQRIVDLLKNGAHSLAAPNKAEEEAAFASEDIDQILTARTEKRQIGSRAGNTFSVATFAAAEEERGNDQDYWAALLPDAVASHEEAAKAAHAAKLAGVVEPRKRRKINYAIHQAASDGDSDYSEDTKKAAAQDKESTRAAKAAARAAAAVEAAKQWKKAEVKALVEGFVTFGEGRTEEVRRHAGLLHRPEEEVAGAERVVVALIAHMVIATKGGGYTRHGCPISAINEAALLEFLKLADAPSTVKAAFTGQSFIKAVHNDGLRWTRAFLERSRLLARMLPPAPPATAAAPEAAAEGAVQEPSPPPHPKAWAPRIKRTSGLPHWWNRTFDTALLAGSYKHGMPNTAFRKHTESILTDSELGFADVLLMATAAEPTATATATVADPTAPTNALPSPAVEKGSDAPTGSVDGKNVKPDMVLVAVPAAEGEKATDPEVVLAEKEVAASSEGSLGANGASPAGSGSDEPRRASSGDVQQQSTAAPYVLPPPCAAAVAKAGELLKCEVNRRRLSPLRMNESEWRKMTDRVTARLRALLLTVRTGMDELPSPKKQSKLPTLPSYTASVTDSVRAKILARLNGGGSEVKPSNGALGGNSVGGVPTGGAPAPRSSPPGALYPKGAKLSSVIDLTGGSPPKAAPGVTPAAAAPKPLPVCLGFSDSSSDEDFSGARVMRKKPPSVVASDPIESASSDGVGPVSTSAGVKVGKGAGVVSGKVEGVAGAVVVASATKVGAVKGGTPPALADITAVCHASTESLQNIAVAASPAQLVAKTGTACLPKPPAPIKEGLESAKACIAQSGATKTTPASFPAVTKKATISSYFVKG